MTANSRRQMNVAGPTAAVLAGLLLASCVAPYAPPSQVQASNPTVTYKYRSDRELLQVNQNAANFCSQYQSVPRTANFTGDPDGSKVVNFECVPQAPPTASVQQFTPNPAYSYRTDQELLDASRNAQSYCLSNGSQQVISNTTTSANGTKTFTFRCSS